MKPKVVILATVAAVVLGAFVSAAPASASWFVPANTGTTYLTGTPSSEHIFTTGYGEMSCAASPIESSITAPTENIEVWPLSNYSKCTFFGTSKPLNTNGCGFMFHANGTTELGPAGCGPMKISTTECSMSIYPRSNLQTTYQTTGTKEGQGIEIHISATNLHYSGNCGIGSGENGIYTGSWAVKGSKNSAGTEPAGISFAQKAPQALSVTSGKFSATTYPAPLAAKMTKAATLSVGPESYLQCKSATAEANSLKEATSTLQFLTSFGECSMNGFSATARMNFCLYEFGAASSQLVQSCFNQAQAVVLEAKLLGSVLCTVSIPTQTLGTITYGTVGSGFQQRVTAAINGSNVTYSEAPGGICGIGSGSNGKFSSEFELSAQK